MTNTKQKQTQEQKVKVTYRFSDTTVKRLRYYYTETGEKFTATVEKAINLYLDKKGVPRI